MTGTIETCLSCGFRNFPPPECSGAVKLIPVPWLCPECRKAISKAKAMVDPLPIVGPWIFHSGGRLPQLPMPQLHSGEQVVYSGSSDGGVMWWAKKEVPHP